MTTKITEKNISELANAGVNWQSVFTGDGSTGLTAVAGRGYFIDTTSGTVTATLPGSPSAGDTIAIKDYAGTFGTNNLTIGRNGNNIQGVANDSLISTNRASIVLVYIDATKGWLYTNESNVADLGEALFVTATGGTITESGNFKIHSFTGDGCFVVSCGGNPGGSTAVDYLVVAGGGGGNGNRGGGGGAGGYRTSFPSPGCNAGAFPITATTYPITVGAGGAASDKGSNSTFSTITATGGGAANDFCTPACSDSDGGSGGGGSIREGTAGGSGNTPPTSPPQGNPGGTALAGNPMANAGAGGGGGGATAAGQAGQPNKGGDGGAGAPNNIANNCASYAGGGGGGGAGPGTQGCGPGAGGAGGGGTGGGNPGTNSTAGTANTGGGGGGGADGSYYPCAMTDGEAGGKGIVIIRYKFQ